MADRFEENGGAVLSEEKPSSRRAIGRIAIGGTEWPVLNRLRSGPDAPVHTYILLNSMGSEYRLERIGDDWTMSGKHLPPQTALNRRGQRRPTNWARLKDRPWFELPWAQRLRSTV